MPRFQCWHHPYLPAADTVYSSDLRRTYEQADNECRLWRISGRRAIHSFLSWLSPDEWSAVGVLASISIAIITCVVNWYYRCKTTRATIRALKCSCKTQQTES
ncbi:phage holin [Pantoea septica]|uniref:phage holin n=1 Tax=Pantoea septica TaxID=472695 RepID=UPI00289A8921|nr:phage holin [Pantoea septica]